MARKNTRNLNSIVESVLNEMNNTMRLLHNEDLVYFYNYASIQENTDNKVMISWNNHISSRFNAGKSFTTLDQYKYILDNNSFHCIMYDGSLIRSSYKFEKNKIINHSHLWWPSPYVINQNFNEEYTPSDAYEEFTTSRDWEKQIRMRSPVRIDFDPGSASDLHPAVHMHTQHHECRMKIEAPICFNRFIKYILQNFYPHLSTEFLFKLNLFNFSYEKMRNFDFNGVSIGL